MAATYSDYGSGATFSSPLAAIAWNSGSGPADGTLMLAIAESNNGSTITPPSEWSTLFNDSGDVTSQYTSVGVFWKIASSEPASLTWTCSNTGVNLSVSMISITGANPGPPSIVQNSGTTASLTAGPLTPPTSNCLMVGMFAARTGITALPADTGYTQRVFSDYASNSWATMIETSNSLSSGSAVSIAVTATGTVSAINGFVLAVSSVTYITMTDTGPAHSDSIATSISVSLAFSDTGPAISDMVGLAASITSLGLSDTGPAISDSFSIVVVNPQAAITLNSQTVQTFPFGPQDTKNQKFFPFGPAIIPNNNPESLN